MKVKLSDIIEAIEFLNDDTYFFLDRVTGEIVCIDDFSMDTEEREEAYEVLDEHGCYKLPEQWELNGYHTMEEFIDTLPPAAQERLSIAISGRGAFRRFKDEVYRLGLEKEWYKFLDDSNKRKAIEWCEENGIEYEE